MGVRGQLTLNSVPESKRTRLTLVALLELIEFQFVDAILPAVVSECLAGDKPPKTSSCRAFDCCLRRLASSSSDVWLLIMDLAAPYLGVRDRSAERIYDQDNPRSAR